MFEKLPDELVLNILSFLRPAELRPLSAVDSRLKRLTGDPIFWQQMWKGPWQDVEPKWPSHWPQEKNALHTYFLFAKKSLHHDSRFATFTLRVDAVSTAIFSPNEKSLAVGFFDGTIALMDTQTAKITRVFEGHSNSVTSLTFSSDLLVSASLDSTLKVWDPSSGKLLQTIDEETHDLKGIHISPGSARLFTHFGDLSIRLWDHHSSIRISDASTQFRKSICYLSDKEIISGTCDNQLCIWDAKTGRRLLSSEKTAGYVTDLALNDTQIATTSIDHTIRIWNKETLQPIQTFGYHNNGITSTAFSRDGVYLASGSYDKKLILLNLKNLETKTFTSKSIVKSLAFTEAGQLLASFENNALLKYETDGPPIIQRTNVKGYREMTFSSQGSYVFRITYHGNLDLSGVLF